MGKKRLVIGILAHVDAGKTTLAEAMLYKSGSIRKAGRVDHGDTFLDTDARERARGITIFSKQAEISWKEMDAALLDTPGHVDFSAEMERTLQVLDYAVLVISGADGVQGHVMTLWKLLERYRIPVFLFINKMDQPGTDKEALFKELQERLSGQCVDFSADRLVGHGGICDGKPADDADVCDGKPADDADVCDGKPADDAGVSERKSAGYCDICDEILAENIAMCDEKLLEGYLEKGKIARAEAAALLKRRGIFPCYFGSALLMEGVDALLDGVAYYGLPGTCEEAFGARVYKIGRDNAGNRLTYMKITGGSLQVKQTVSSKEGGWEEKVDQIRVYSGLKYTAEKEVSAGMVCAVTGLEKTYAGEGLGFEGKSMLPMLAPVMSYRVLPPADCDLHSMYQKLCQLEEEEPLLNVLWKEQVGEIHVQLMGEVQIEVLQNLIAERFGEQVAFDAGSIHYKETIRKAVEGVGHFEPLRHYAEVHLWMEPGEPGSGLVFDTICNGDMLDKNWQRLVLTHLEETEHPGILTGAPITDMKITLVSGRAHLKHTEGGDFRQATYRAVRQGLHKAECVLLEPVYEFRLELPSAMIGRAMSDIQSMHGQFEAPLVNGDTSVLTGVAPVVEMQGYQAKVRAYSGGSGRLFCSLKGYEPCHNAEEVIEASGYEAGRDIEHPASSVFCAHGAGFLVEWDEVEKYMHLEGYRPSESTHSAAARPGNTASPRGYDYRDAAGEKELEEIFRRTYGKKSDSEEGGRKKWGYRGNLLDGPPDVKRSQTPKLEEYLLVDGYNILFAWDELKELAEENLDSARGALMDILSNYQGYRGMTLILVFDAYKVKGNPGSVLPYHNIHVVYTKEAETADQYIERVTHEIGRKHRVVVATSDGLEQLIIMGQGAERMSARTLKEEIMSTNWELRALFESGKASYKRYLFDQASEELAQHIEEVRLGEKEF
ncbi:MAG: TetM/TetW/TetO/TetS family tetracycline resistance ribosomal protection protein [Muribaculaceae bacterium]|nr:TetM/TetW/TetO/TetS family tetracycline resistance ribosomal protection protein [Muribaculaceae bacterium]